VQVKKYRPTSGDAPLLNLNVYMQELFYVEPLLLAYDDKLARL
jgi:hypothetical protein